MKRRIKVHYFLKTLYRKELINIINELKNFSSPGEDGSTKLDTVWNQEIVRNKLLELINSVLNSGLFP